MANAPETTELLIPPGTELGRPVDVSIVVPALNEEITVGEFVDWCKQGLAEAGVTGQILIVDSSTDRTPEIALARGAEVLRTPKRGLGRAYIDAIPFIRGPFVIMGDADLTYDFRQLKPFLEKFREGNDYVMGSRFRGSIEPGSMPNLHRYFGTPLTTWILNAIYGSHYTDIHCGMRGISREALRKLNLQSQSWEYASEMVLKASSMRLKVAEVPVSFYKDRQGRESHHKRMGWLSPWIAGWINLRAMLVYSPDTFLIRPGAVLFALGLMLTVWISAGPQRLGGMEFNLNWMLFGVTCATLGFSCFQLGLLARTVNNLRPDLTAVLSRFWSYDRGMILAGSLTLAGLSLVGVLVARYIEQGLRLSEFFYPAPLGLLLILLGFQSFSFTLLLELLLRVKREDRRDL